MVQLSSKAKRLQSPSVKFVNTFRVRGFDACNAEPSLRAPVCIMLCKQLH